MNSEEIFKLIEDNGLTLHGDIEHFAALVADHVYARYLEQPTPNLTGVISITIPEPIGYLCENAVGHKYFRWKKPPSTYKPIALYTSPPQQELVCVCGAVWEGQELIYTTPQRTWVGLTDDERAAIGREMAKTLPNRWIDFDYARAVEAKLKEKNT